MSDSAPKDYKATLNLPQTEFPMKGNLAQLEPKVLEKWEAGDVFGKMLAARKDADTFVLHDGPPYANGHLHAGHALNKILKDLVVKYRHLSGKRTDFVPGWDCHGLPIEQAVEKRLRDKKIDKRTLSREEFLQKCREYALEFIDIQRREFKRMGVLGRWEHPYQTLDFAYEAQEIRELSTFAEKGMLYRKKKPVYWCITDQTALAEAEVEYEDHSSPSIYVAFPAKGDLAAKWSAVKGRSVAFAIWTTTPWTLPANLAISVHPKFEYVFYALDEQRVVVVAKDMLASFLAACAPTHLKSKEVKLGEGTFDSTALTDATRIVAYASGEDLKGLEYTHVLNGKACPVVLGEHVTLEAGTGLVHTAPGHGQEDYEMGLQYGLDIYNPVKNDGRYDATVDAKLQGQKVFDANPMVVDWLVEKGALLNPKGETVKHSYPHCWRCHNPVIFRATHQWFISLDGTKLREHALHQVDTAVTWVPKWGRERIRGMLEGRPDWCISRQRTWGVPIPVALCEGCEEAHVDHHFMERVADAVEKSGASAWYSTPVENFLPKGHTCPKCGGTKFRRETDILDVWFDSACSFAAVAARRENMSIPVDLYLEGSDQHRGWFHSSLLVGVGTRGFAPYKTCLTHGFVVDGNGNKMSKSLGNTVSPEDIIKEFGAEILRMWVASADYRDDVRLSKPILSQLSESYRKVRNTLRYALSNLYDFDPAKDAVPHEKLLPLEQWVLKKLDLLTDEVKKAYDAYEFHLVSKRVVDFCANELSAQYFDIQKDALYTGKKTGPKRRSAQTAMYRIAKDLLVMLAPVTSFTAEEAWGYLPGAKAESVFLNRFPAPQGVDDDAVVAELDQLFAVRAGILPLYEAARRDKLIGKSLEAKVTLTATGATAALLEKWKAELPELFIASQVVLSPTASEKAQAATPEVKALIEQATGNKCPRCWTYRPEVGAQELCQRCTDAIA
ncbi:MAG: isoleucine--tRNA ligase [Myxococcota bacterium]